MNWSFIERFLNKLTAIIAAIANVITSSLVVTDTLGSAGVKIILIAVSILSTLYLCAYIILLTSNILSPCRAIGIKAIHSPKIRGRGGNIGLAHERIGPYLKEGRKLRSLQIIGTTLFKNMKTGLVEFLSRDGADATILICDPNSSFASGIAHLEEHPCDHETEVRKKRQREEVIGTVDELNSIIRKVHSATTAQHPAKQHGWLKFGIYHTQYRNAILTCDDFGWLTISLPPARNVDLPSLELTGAAGSGRDDGALLLSDANKHIDEIASCIEIIEWRPNDGELDLFAAIKEKYNLDLRT